MDYDATIKICMFADNDVGKKTFTQKFIGPVRKDDLSMTIGVDLRSKEIDIDGKILILQFWIANIEERFQDIWKGYIRDCKGVILMYDITNAKSLNRLSEWVQLIRNNLEYDDVPILLVGNKLDLEENREISKEQVENFITDNDISESMEISLQTAENVEKMFLKFFINIFLKKNYRIRRKTKGKESLRPISRRQYAHLERPENLKKNLLESSKSLEVYLNSKSTNTKYMYLPILIAVLTLLNVVGVFMTTNIQRISFISFVLIFIIVLTAILLIKRKKKKGSSKINQD